MIYCNNILTADEDWMVINIVCKYGKMQSPINMEIEPYDIEFSKCLPEIKFGPTFNETIRGHYKIVKHTGL